MPSPTRVELDSDVEALLVEAQLPATDLRSSRNVGLYGLRNRGSDGSTSSASSAAHPEDAKLSAAF